MGKNVEETIRVLPEGVYESLHNHEKILKALSHHHSRKARRAMEKYIRDAEAEPLYKRALKIREKTLGKNHPHVAQSLNNLAGLYRAQDKFAEAESLFNRALAIAEKALGKNHHHVAIVCENMAKLYKKIGKEDEPERLEERARRIRSNQ